ncbi:MAG: thioredoxin family protein [Planctomycetota bacterium]|nr:thioredoxin family protein [Planctomycetota bacterium]
MRTRPLPLVIVMLAALSVACCGKEPGQDGDRGPAKEPAPQSDTPEDEPKRVRKTSLPLEVVEGDAVPADARLRSGETSSDEELPWTVLKDVDHLDELIAGTTKPTIVLVWATWCTYCQHYRSLMRTTPELRSELAAYERLLVDITRDNQEALREALGIDQNIQPYIVFLDAKRRVRRALDVDRWYGDDLTPERLLARLRAVRGF